MEFAYLILAHNKPKQLKRMINALSSPNNHFFIHIDKKSNFRKFYFILHRLNNPNIHYIDKRFNVNWGSFSIVKAIIYGLKIISRSEKKFDYITLLSGQDYPIKNNKHIYNFFLENNGKEFISGSLLFKRWAYGMDRITRYYFMDIGNRYIIYAVNKINKYFPKRKFLKNYIPYGGSAWWSITYECVNYILDFIEKNPQFIKFYKYTLLPDEMFFHTIIFNSSFRNKVCDDNLRYIKFIGKDAHPKIFNHDDFNVLSSVDKLFARKFDNNHNKSILDLIDEKILFI